MQCLVITKQKSLDIKSLLPFLLECFDLVLFLFVLVLLVLLMMDAVLLAATFLLRLACCVNLVVFVVRRVFRLETHVGCCPRLVTRVLG